MNRYGRLAMEQMRRQQPDLLAAIPDPEAYFTTAGEQMQAAVTAARDEILGPMRPGETLEQFRQRSYSALRQAEELVLSDQAQPDQPDEDDDGPDPALESYYSTLSSMADLTNRVDSEPTEAEVADLLRQRGIPVTPETIDAFYRQETTAAP